MRRVLLIFLPLLLPPEKIFSFFIFFLFFIWFSALLFSIFLSFLFVFCSAAANGNIFNLLNGAFSQLKCHTYRAHNIYSTVLVEHSRDGYVCVCVRYGICVPCGRNHSRHFNNSNASFELWMHVRVRFGLVFVANDNGRFSYMLRAAWTHLVSHGDAFSIR